MEEPKAVAASWEEVAVVDKAFPVDDTMACLEKNGFAPSDNAEVNLPMRYRENFD